MKSSLEAVLAILIIISPSVMFYLTNGLYLKSIPFIVFQLALYITPLAFKLITLKRFIFLLLPALVLCFINWGHFSLYHYEITTGGVQAILESNPSESSEFLGRMPIPLFCFAIFASGFFFYSMRRQREENEDALITHKITKIISLGIVLAFMALKFYQSKSFYGGIEKSLLIAQPFKTALVFYHGITKNIEYRQKIKDQKFIDFEVSKTGDKPINYVIIIGESSRRNNWSLYGYNRKTNPLLEKRKEDLVIFSDVISPANATLQSLQQMLALYDNDHFGTLMMLVKKAGFETYWFSNQAKFGEFDTMTTLLAKTSRHSHFSNTDTSSVSYDEKILPKLSEVISKKSENNFIVLHTIGSHFYYDRRYPKAFNQFTSLDDLQIKRKEINQYDNTLLYTDFIIDGAISQIENSKTPSAVIFVSDHGEALFDGDEVFGHGGPVFNMTEVEVPFIFYFNQAFKTSFPQKVELVKKAQNNKVNLKDFLSSFSDFMGIEFKRKTHSFFRGHSKLPREIKNLNGKTIYYAEDL